MKQNAYDYSFELRRKRQHRISFVLSLLISVVLFLSLFMNLVVFPVHVSSESMEPDIAKSSAVFVCPLLRTPKRGDVVYVSRLDNAQFTWFERGVNILAECFTAQKYYPFGFTSNVTGRPMLRRVVGLPGDTIYMRDYVLYVIPRGQTLALTEEQLISRRYTIRTYSVPAEWDNMGSYGNMEQVVLGDDEYFVLADNRIEATDSRVWGPLKASSIKGRALLEYFPFNKLRIF